MHKQTIEISVENYLLKLIDQRVQVYQKDIPCVTITRNDIIRSALRVYFDNHEDTEEDILSELSDQTE